MAAVIYGLCTLTAGLCAWLLLSAYARNQYRLLLWGGLCFGGLTVTNAVLMADKVLLGPAIDLSIWRYSLMLASLLVFIYGLIWDTE